MSENHANAPINKRSEGTRKGIEILGYLELWLTIVQFGLEIASVFVDSTDATIWIGFTGIFLFVPFVISLFRAAYKCCGGDYFNPYQLILAVLCTLFSLMIIICESYFLSNPCKCFSDDKTCCALGSLFELFNGQFKDVLTVCTTLIDGKQSDYSNIICRSMPTKKIPYIYGQLIVGILMFISCFIYSIYLIRKFLSETQTSELDRLGQSGTTEVNERITSEADSSVPTENQINTIQLKQSIENPRSPSKPLH